MNPAVRSRCAWVGSEPLYLAYHDEEWGVPVHDDRKIFEMLILEGFPAGVSWITILRKRLNFRKAFKNFDPRKVARFGKADVSRLLRDGGIIRNRLKIEAAVRNAKAFLAVQKEFGSFDAWKADFKAAAVSAKLSGWALLVHDRLLSGRLLNVLVDEHQYGAIWGGMPLIACDVFEHAYYHKDGPGRAKYIDNFIAHLHWGRINERFRKLVR